MLAEWAKQIIRAVDPTTESREHRAALDEMLCRTLIAAGWSEIAREVTLDAMSIYARQRWVTKSDREQAYWRLQQMIAMGRADRLDLQFFLEATPFALEFAQAFGYTKPKQMLDAARSETLAITEDRICVFAAAMVIKITNG